jgi:hypothetical protein
MSRLLSSARFRRRLVRYGGALVVLGGVVFVGIHWANTGAKLSKPNGGPVQTVPPAPKNVHRTPKELNEVRGIAEHFIRTAVYRRHLDEAWALAAPSLREGMSISEWRTGNIPVVPFRASDVSEIKYRFAYSLPTLIGMKIALVPKPTAQRTGLVANLELQRVGKGTHRHWLVDAWVPLGGGEDLHRAIGQVGAQQVARTNPRLGSVWLFLPFAIIGGMILALPFGLGIRGWVRRQRAERAYNSSSSPS